MKKYTPWESVNILLSRYFDGTFREILDDWKWIFSYSARYKKAIFFYVFLGILSTTLGLAGSIASKYLIDIITGYKYEQLTLMICLLVGSSLISLAFNSIISRITAKLSIRINNDIQADIFDKIIDADWLSLNKYSHGDVLNRFNQDVSTVSTNAVNWLPTIILALYNFIATFLVILHYDVIMALISFLSAPLMFLVSHHLISRQRAYNKEVRRMNSDLMTFEIETFYNLDTIKSLGVTPTYGRKMRWWQDRFKGVTLDYNLFQIKTNILLSVFGMLVQFTAFGYALYLLWTKAITYGTMTLFLQQRSNLSTAFNNVLSIVPSFLGSSVSAHRIRELVELPKEVHMEESHVLDAMIADGFRVEVQDLTFSYIDDKQIITDSALTASPGEIIAIIGPSGEGKTTLIRLLLGLMSPQEGTVRIYSSDNTSVPMNAETRHLFSYVPQGNTILSGTIAENLRMIKEDATEEEMIRALEIACAWDFVKDMPNGLDSSVGERGRGLSEGQAQRIAIARAVLRDAPILLLDEATSALDTATERRVLRSIIQNDPHKTCIVTTHRPSVLNLCKRVYRVKDTRITELDAQDSAREAMDF